jgi:hypothetical protein
MADHGCQTLLKKGQVYVLLSLESPPFGSWQRPLAEFNMWEDAAPWFKREEYVTSVSAVRSFARDDHLLDMLKPEC